jgi:hypothetical protein
MRGHERMSGIPPHRGPALAQRAGAIPRIPLMPSHPSPPALGCLFKSLALGFLVAPYATTLTPLLY